MSPWRGLALRPRSLSSPILSSRSPRVASLWAGITRDQLAEEGQGNPRVVLCSRASVAIDMASLHGQRRFLKTAERKRQAVAFSHLPFFL